MRPFTELLLALILGEPLSRDESWEIARRLLQLMRENARQGRPPTA